MTTIVKLVVDGEEHWTAEGSPAHEQLLARQRDADQETGDAGQGDAGQTEEGAGAQQQEPQVPGEGDGHDPASGGGGSGDGSGVDGGAARRTGRSGSSESASGR